MTRTMDSRSRRLAAATATFALVLGGTLTACGEDTEPTEPDSSSTSSSAPGEQVVDVTFEGDTVTPNGERVEATVGEEITLRITADAPGEIHVHSSPEQELSYEAGTTDLPLTIDEPGVIDVESHDLDMVIVQLEVR